MATFEMELAILPTFEIGFYEFPVKNRFQKWVLVTKVAILPTFKFKSGQRYLKQKPHEINVFKVFCVGRNPCLPTFELITL